MKIDFEWLEDNVMLTKLSAEELQHLGEVLEIKEYSPGEEIMHEGQPGGQLFILRSGEAEISHVAHGEKVEIAKVSEGALLGEMTFLTGEPASAEVIALTPCVAYRLTRASYSMLMQSHQDMVYSLFAYMLVHAASIIRRMNEEHVILKQYVLNSDK